MGKKPPKIIDLPNGNTGKANVISAAPAQTQQPEGKLKKSLAKAYGLKSIFVLDGKYLLTTYGKQEKPIVLEQVYTPPKVQPVLVDPEQTFTSSTMMENDFHLVPKRALPKPKEGEPRMKYLTVSKPPMSKIGLDYLGFKPKLEKELFGEVKEDNIHVQIAYNILDLKKIIGMQIGDVVATLRNLGSRSNPKLSDLVGNVDYTFPLESLKDGFIAADLDFFEAIKPYNSYFHEIFRYERTDDYLIDAFKERGRYYQSSKFNYNVLRALSFLRQGCVHGGNRPALLFEADRLEQEGTAGEFVKMAKGLFASDAQKFKDDFLTRSGANLRLLFEVEGCENLAQKQELAKQYYDFLIKRADKQLGFSLQTIRAAFVDRYCKRLIEKEGQEEWEVNTLRPKFNNILGFLLYHFYKDEHPERAEALVERLRALPFKDEEAKEGIYEAEYKEISSPALFGRTKLDATYAALQKWIESKGKDKASDDLESIVAKLPVHHISGLAACVYVACKFLDGKEVNELLTSIIDKFEGIKTLVDVLDHSSIGKWNGFAGDYECLNDRSIEAMIDDFWLIKSFASMKINLKKEANAKRDREKKEKHITLKYPAQLYVDAYNLISSEGFIGLEDVYDDPFFSEENMNKRKGEDNPFRGHALLQTKGWKLIENSIIANRRFAYLVKYLEPKQCHELMSNKSLIRFILGEVMPEKDKKGNKVVTNQLFRYYKAICEEASDFASLDSIVNQLAKELSNLNARYLHDLVSTYSKEKKIDQFDPRKARVSELTSLYLTVAYLLVKGFIHTNAFYFIAWSMYERDIYYRLGRKEASYLELTRAYNGSYKNEHPSEFEDYMISAPAAQKKERVKKLLEKNIADSADFDKVYNRYRNDVVHLNLYKDFPRLLNDIGKVSSYFDMYSYAMQRRSLDLIENKAIKESLRNQLDTYHSYQRDFLKLINLPFAYNLPRYKNLTIGDLFNGNYPLTKTVKEEWIEDKGE